MISYNEFLYCVKEGLHNYMPPEYEDITVEVIRADMRIKRPYDGLSVTTADSEVGVCLDLTGIYESIEEEGEVGAAISFIAEMATQSLDNRPDDLGDILGDPTVFREHLMLRLVNRHTYSDILDRIPHKVMDDMVLLYTLVTIRPTGDVYGTIVTADMMKGLGLDGEGIHELAVRNSRRNFPMKLETLGDDEKKIYIASCNHEVGGAACMFYPNFVSEALKRIKGSFFIFPTSVNRLILIRDRGVLEDAELRELTDILLACNMDSREYLTDEIYYCDARKKKITRLGGHVC